MSGDDVDYRLCGETWARVAKEKPRPAARPSVADVSVTPGAPSWLTAERAAEFVVRLTDSKGAQRAVVVSNGAAEERLRLSGGGGGEVASGVLEIGETYHCFTQLPQSSYKDMKKLRWPDEQEGDCPGCITPTVSEGIGPFAHVGGTIWFGLSFYDGEGSVGFGGIGSYDAGTRKYEIFHPRGLIDWSASAILADGGSVWVGLVCHEEYINPTGGVARYDLASRQVQRFLVPGLVRAIVKHGDGVLVGTSTALGTIRSGGISCFQIGSEGGGATRLVGLAQPFGGVFMRSQEAPGP